MLNLIDSKIMELHIIHAAKEAVGNENPELEFFASVDQIFDKTGYVVEMQQAFRKQALALVSDIL